MQKFSKSCLYNLFISCLFPFRYFFEIDGGKKIRPTMVLAISYALNAGKINSFGICDAYGHASPSQKRLAEITEMIHTASLFHDDVIDKVLFDGNRLKFVI